MGLLGRITQSNRSIAILRISVIKKYFAIHQIEINIVESIIRSSNNRGKNLNSIDSTLILWEFLSRREWDGTIHYDASHHRVITPT